MFLRGLCRASSIMLVLLLSACAGSEKPPKPAFNLQINGLIFENRSQSAVTAVRLIVPRTQNFVSCGNVPPGGVCSSRFPEVAYSGNPVEVSWSQQGQIWSTGVIEARVTEEVIEHGEAEVRVVIISPGSAAVLLVIPGEGSAGSRRP